MVAIRGKPKKTYRKVRNDWRALKSMVVRQIDRNVENKQITVSLNATYGAITSNWTESDLTNVAEGVTGNGRIGRKLKLRSIEVKGVMATGDSESLADDPYNVVRIVIGLWSGSAGATPLGTALTTINAPIRKNLGTRNFLIRKYYDKYIPLSVTSTEKGGGDGYTPQTKLISYFKRFKRPILITYGDDTVTYPDKRFIFAAISDSSGVPSPGFIAGYIVVSYEDA